MERLAKALWRLARQAAGMIIVLAILSLWFWWWWY